MYIQYPYSRSDFRINRIYQTHDRPISTNHTNMATTEPSSLPAAAEAANVNTLTTALEETHITETGKDTKTEAKANGEDDLEEGEIRDEEEVDDGKPKTVFDSKKNYNLKVGSLHDGV